MRLARVIADIILIFCIFWLPWWLTLFLGICGLFIFESYFEIVIVGILLDSLYAVPVVRFYHFQFVVTILTLILFVIVSMLKKRLRFYA